MPLFVAPENPKRRSRPLGESLRQNCGLKSPSRGWPGPLWLARPLRRFGGLGEGTLEPAESRSNHPAKLCPVGQWPLFRPKEYKQRPGGDSPRVCGWSRNPLLPSFKQRQLARTSRSARCLTLLRGKRRTGPSQRPDERVSAEPKEIQTVLIERPPPPSGGGFTDPAPGTLWLASVLGGPIPEVALRNQPSPGRKA